MDDLKFRKFVVVLLILAATFAFVNMWQVLLVLTLTMLVFVVIKILRIFFLDNNKSEAKQYQQSSADNILCCVTLMACFLFFTLVAFISAK